MASKPKPVGSEPAERAPPTPAYGVTLYRGAAVESMNEAQLRATVRELLGALRGIAGMQSDRQIRRTVEGLGL